MMPSCHCYLTAQSLLQRFPEVRCEFHVSVRHDSVRHPMQSHHIFDKVICCVQGCIGFSARDQMYHAGQAADEHQDCIAAVLGFRKTSNPIHLDLLPRASWGDNTLRLSLSSLSINFLSLANVTGTDVVVYVTRASLPVIICLHTC